MAGSGIRFALSARGGHISIRLLFSYAFDWLFLIVVPASLPCSGGSSLKNGHSPSSTPASRSSPPCVCLMQLSSGHLRLTSTRKQLSFHRTRDRSFLLTAHPLRRGPNLHHCYRLHHLRAWPNRARPNRAQRHSQDIDMEAKALGALRGLAGSCVSSFVSVVLH